MNFFFLYELIFWNLFHIIGIFGFHEWKGSTNNIDRPEYVSYRGSDNGDAYH